MKKGKMADSDGIALPNKTTMKGKKEDELSVFKSNTGRWNETQGNEGKSQNRVLYTSEKNTRNEIEWWKYNNRNKYVISHCILGNILYDGFPLSLE